MALFPPVGRPHEINTGVLLVYAMLPAVAVGAAFLAASRSRPAPHSHSPLDPFRRCGAILDRSGGLQALEGKPAPALEFDLVHKWRHGAPHLESLRGNVVLLSFVSPWIVDAYGHVDQLKRIPQASWRRVGKAESLVIVLVVMPNDWIEHKEWIEEFLKREPKVDWVIATPADPQATAQDFRLPSELSGNYLIDREGVLRFAAIWPSDVPAAANWLLGWQPTGSFRTNCPHCGASLNVASGFGLESSEIEPWRLICRSCQTEIQPHGRV